MPMKSGKKVGKNLINWILSVFMFTGCLAFGFSFASVLFALLGLSFLPIAPIQNELNKMLPKKKALRVLIAFVVFAVGCGIAPQVETETPELTTATNIIISTETTASATEEATVSSTQNPTTIPKSNPTSEFTIAPTNAPTIEATILYETSKFEIHFIDVGQADAALVLCDGKAMLIDGGNAEDSSLIYTYLKNHNINHLDYVVGTHAHEDHIGGLAGALNYATVGAAYCPVNSYDTKSFSNFVSALSKHGVTITIPSKGDSFPFQMDWQQSVRISRMSPWE